MFDLSIPSAISKKIAEDIEAFSVATYRKPYKRRLGASMLSDPCWQKLWLTFRWCKAETRDGRMYRLLDRGNREETYTFQLLRGIGFELHTHDQNGNQYSMSFHGGHCGSSLDAIGIMPTSYGVTVPVLVSIKTSGTGVGFNKLAGEGIKALKPAYWDQECFYGYGYNIEYALWITTNKNDDSQHIELAKLDLARGEELVSKAGAIIRSQEPMEMISKSPAYKDCSGCTFKGICHKNEAPDTNCRSCQFARPHMTPNSDGKPAWYCGHEYYNAVIPEEIIAKGCELHYPIINGQ